jgi:tetratricopeptide (TPR) repeat protein
MNIPLLVAIALLSITSVSAQVSNDTSGNSSSIDNAKCQEQLSLYREYHKIKLYSYALPHWRWVFQNCPSSSQNIYIDGTKIISSQIDETQDPELKSKLVDTLMMVYDQRIKYHGKEGYVLGRKAIDAMNYMPGDLETAYKLFGKSIELQGNEAEGAVVTYYLSTAIQLANNNKIEKSEIFDAYDKAATITENNISTAAGNEKELANWMNVKANLELLIQPHATCSDLVKIYEKKFAENSEDVNVLKNITSILDRRECTQEGDLFFRATEKLHKLEPSAQSAYLMGRLSISNNMLSKAAEYMSQAADLYTVPEDQVKALYILASIHTNNRNYSQARSAANRILQINPSEGKAYMLIGDLYAASASSCGDDDMGGKTVFWAAVDKYYKAKSVDPSVEQEANEKIGQYSRYFPATSDLFFRDYKEGGSYTVGCWINENTTIRGIK